MKKLPMQQLIEWLERSIEQECYIVNNSKGYHPSDVADCHRKIRHTNEYIDKAREFLPVEKAAIVEAWDDNETFRYNTGEGYLKNTYKSPPTKSQLSAKSSP